MKTFGCVVALAAFTIGFASAGPVAANGGSSNSASMCDIKCGSQNKFSYTPGKSYVYKYSTKTETALEQSSDEKSTIYLDAEVSLHVIDSCRFALKVDSAKLEEEISGGGRKPSRGTQELGESLKKTPLVFNYEDGIVSRLCPAVQESKTALNIKRGILSMMQNKMADFTKEHTAVEDDVVGECRARYSVTKDWGGKVTVLKEKNLSECKRDNDQQVVSVIALPRQLAKSSSMINGTQECTQVIKNSMLESVECRERHVVKPFSRQEKGAATEIHQRLQFQRGGGDIPAGELRYPEAEEETLQYDPIAESESQDNQMEARARAIIQQLSRGNHPEIKETNDHFSKLMESFRRMRYDSLRKLATEFKGNTWLIDALTNTLTGDAMKLVTELVAARVLETTDAKVWLVRVALATDVDASRVQMMLPLLDMEKITVEAHLAVSSMARTFMEENPSEVPEEITNLLRKLYSQLRPEMSPKKMMATVKAIGNIGMSNGQEHTLLSVTAQQKTEVRLAAIEAFRRLPCDTVKREMLMNIFTRRSEDVEVRIAAYLNSITCPTEEMIATIRRTLLGEPKESQMVSFVFTHMKNLAQRSSFHEDVSSITSDESLKSLELDSINFSKNYYYEMFFNPLDMGFEIDAGSIFSNEFTGLMLNTTFDMFGRKVNVFDSKIRVQKDVSHVDGFVRFFGKEVLYNSVERPAKSDLDAILKAVMSRNGWKFTRSMMLLDTESVVPTGSGLPLVVAVNATATLNMDLKATPLQGPQGSKLVAEARSAPSLAVEFGISMMVKAPKTTSGIKMLVTGSSQWELNGRVNIDLSDSRMVRNIQIEAPRDRSDIIDMTSDVYLVGANTEREIKAIGTQQKQWQMCSGKVMRTLIGHEACVAATYPAASDGESPFFMLRGPSRFNVRWVKTDKSLKMFQIQSSFIYGQRELIELAFEMDTPGSQVDRRFKGRLYSDFRERRFGVDLISPLKSVNLEGSYLQTAANKKTQVLLKVDGKTEMSIIGDMNTVNGRAMIMTPSLEVVLRDKKLLAIKGQIVSHGGQKINGELEMTSIMIERPIKMNGEYSTVNNNKRLSFNTDSQWVRTDMQSSLTQQDRNWDLNVQGDYSFNQGAKHTFGIAGKIVDDSQTVAVEGSVKRDGNAYASGRGKFVRGAYPNVDMALDLLQGHFKGALSFTSENENEKMTLVATAANGNDKYSTSIKFNQMPRLTLFQGKLELPNNVQRHIQLQYDLASAVKRLVFDTDLTGKTYSARVSYTPAENLHKMNANVKMGDESLQVAAALGTDSVYQAKLDISHNGAKLLATTVGVNQDMTKPDMKAYLQFRGDTLVDVTTDTVIEAQRVSVALTMRAPVELNANIGLRKSGSVSDTLRLETEVEVQSPDQMINWGLASTAEVSLWQRNNKINAEASFRYPAGTSTLVLNNVLDASSWSIDWRYQGAQQQAKQFVLSSGTYNFDSPKLHLRGVFEMDIRPFGERLVIEPHSLNTELSAHQNEVDLKIEVTKNAAPTVFLVALKTINESTKKHLVIEMNVMGKPYHLQMAVDGQSLSSGFRASLDSRFDTRTIVGKGSLKWDGENINVNTDVRTSFMEFSRAKILLQSQTIGQNARLINTELVFGQHFMKADVSADPNSLEGEIRTSITDWQNLKAGATWVLKPKMHVTVNFSSPKYPNNIIEIDMDYQNREMTGRVRVTVPSMHRSGLLLDGNVQYSNGKGRVNVLGQGKQMGKLLFELKNEKTVKSLSAALSYDTEYASDRWNLELGFENHIKNAYHVSVSLLRNSRPILNVIYKGALNTEGGILAEYQLDATTTLSELWPSVYVWNKLLVNSRNLRMQHQFGKSPNDVRYRLDVSGQLVNNRDMFVVDGKLDGKWDRMLMGSVSAEVKSDKKNNIEWESRVESDRALVCSTKVTLVRRERLIDLAVNWSAPKMQQQGALAMRSGIDETESFIFESKLERDQNPAKSAEISLHFPLKIRNVDGHLKIKMPQELGNLAFLGNIMMKSTMFDVNADLSLENGRQTYSGEASSKWDRDYALNGMLRRNNNEVAKVNLKATWNTPESYEVSGEVMHNEVFYKAGINGAWTQKNGEISMEAESSRWNRRHFLRGAYSKDSKSGDLKVDIADLKMNIDVMMSELNKMRANAYYKDRQIVEVTAIFNPNTKQGTVDTVLFEKRISSTFMLRLANGEFKANFPEGSGSFDWTMDRDERMNVNGQWNFRDESWRVELFADRLIDREVKASLFFKEKSVGTFNTAWKPNRIGLDLHVNWAGMKHSIEFEVTGQGKTLTVHRGELAGHLKINCPWIQPERIESETSLSYDSSKISFLTAAKLGEKVHSIAIDGDIQGERVSGSVQVHWSKWGDMNGKFEGNFNKNGFEGKLTSDKLKQPVEIRVQTNQEKINFKVKGEGLEMNGNIYTGPKFGVQLLGKTDRVYEIVAEAEMLKSLMLTIQTPSIAKTGLVLTQNSPGNYIVEGDWYGKKILQAKWTGTDSKMTDGSFNAAFDFGSSVGKHNLIVTYSLTKVPSAKIELDGHVIFNGTFDSWNHRMSGTLTMKFARGGDLTLSFKHELNRELWVSSLKITQNGKTLGHEMRLHRNIYGSMLRIDTPQRSVLAAVDNKQSESVTGRISWDHGRDAQKTIEVTLSPENNSVRGVRRERHLTVSVPKIGEKMVIRFTETDDGHQIQTLDEKHPTTAPRMSLTYSKQGLLHMTLGNLMMQAEVSAKKSELILRRLSMQEDDINVGYNVQGNTLSARLNWSPRLVTHYELAAKDMLKEIQKGANSRQDKQWRKISELIATELHAIRNDIRQMISDLELLYEENAWNLKTIFESIVRVARHISDYTDAVSAELNEIIRDFKRLMTRYIQRLSVASTVVGAIRQEIAEDFIDSVERWLIRVERSIPNEYVRNVVHRLSNYVKRDYEAIVNALDSVVDEYVCEFSSDQAQVTNKRCGFTYELNSHNEQQGLMMRLPLQVSLGA